MPNMNAQRLRKDASNTDILNAIRKNATVDYQRRIPDATKANYRQTIQNLMTNHPLRNEFIDALVNRIGLTIFKANVWTNPLAKFKRGLLEYGDTIEEVQAGLLDAYVYNPDRDYLEQSIFGQERPEVQSSFHKINRQNFYKLTVNQDLLKRAFLEDGGLNTFINNLMNMPTTSDNWDEFLSMANLFREYYEADGFFKVQVGDVSAQGSDSDDAKYMLRRLRELASTLPYISRHYNAAGLPVSAQMDELELFITPEANAALDVEALAAAFNVDYSSFPSRSTVIPKEHMNIPGVQAILTTRDFFVVADTNFATTSQPNPVGLTTNYFLHHWEVISASRFVPAIMFTTEAGTVITLTDEPVSSVPDIVIEDRDGDTVTNLERGGLYQVNVNAITDPVGGFNDSVILTLTGATDPRTQITNAGALYVSPSESSEQLTVTATAVGDSSKSTTTTRTVVGDLLTLWPDPSVTPDSDDDGLLEVTPEEPDFTDNTITIPTVVGVQYQNGATNLNNGSTVDVADGTPVTITATARAGYELATGATASWTFTYAA